MALGFIGADQPRCPGVIVLICSGRDIDLSFLGSDPLIGNVSVASSFSSMRSIRMDVSICSGRDINLSFLGSDPLIGNVVDDLLYARSHLRGGGTSAASTFASIRSIREALRFIGASALARSVCPVASHSGADFVHARFELL
jgi:hypothetical protein